MSKNAPMGFSPSAPMTDVPLPPPSYDEAMGGASGRPPVMMQQMPYPPQPCIVQQHIGQPQPGGIPHGTVPIVAVSVGPKPASLECPHCHKHVKSNVNTEIQKSAHVACLLLMIFGCFLCSCLPYFLEAFKNVHHFCPQCKAFIGTYKR